MTYFRHAIEYLKTNVLNLPPTEPEPDSQSTVPQSYTQSLLSRFSIPSAGSAGVGIGNTGNDFYNLLASAVSAATSASRLGSGSSNRNMTESGTLIPPHLRGSAEKMNFIAAQRERLNIVMNALDREAQEIQRGGPPGGFGAESHENEDDEPTQRPPSGLSMFSALSKSRSETDFEKVEAESGTEDDLNLRRRHVSSPNAAGGSWMPWGWGSGAGGADTPAGSRKED